MKTVEIDSVYFFYLKYFEGVYSPFGLFYSSLKIVLTPRLVYKNSLDHGQDIVKSRPLTTFESRTLNFLPLTLGIYPNV